MAKNSPTTKPHHRRPESIGGTKLPRNISYVNIRLHQHWHTLYGNMNAIQTCERINNSEYKPKNVKVICKFINGSQVTGSGGYFSNDRDKIAYAWAALFGNKCFRKAIDQMNNIWLDPSYEFEVVKK